MPGISYLFSLLIFISLAWCFCVFLGIEDEGWLQPVEEVRRSSRPVVRFLVAQTHASKGWCHMLASAILSNVSVTTIGYGGVYSHVRRVSWVMEYIMAERLEDNDVIVSFDGADTLLTGMLPMRQAVERFIATTAPTADAFSAEAVRRGEATSPLLFTAERNCYHPQLAPRSQRVFAKVRCISAYKRVEENFLMSNISSHARKQKKFRYLNAGGYVGRVWAIKRAVAAFQRFTAGKRWWCDQTVWGMLYLQSRKPQAPMGRGTPIPFGMMNLDFHNSFFLSLFGVVWERDLLSRSSTEVGQLMANGVLPLPLLFTVSESPHATPAVVHFNGGLWKKGEFAIMRSHTSWFAETTRSPEALAHAKSWLRSGAFLTLYNNSGETALPYGSVCNADALWVQ